VADDASYIETANGRERLARPGGPFASWEGWQLCYIRDVPIGYTIRYLNREFPIASREARGNCLDIRSTDQVIKGGGFIMWGGCLVWTYLG